MARKPRMKPPKITDPLSVNTNPHAQSNFPSYKKGGKVKKTGLALVHKGETVVPVKKRGTSDGYMTNCK